MSPAVVPTLPAPAPPMDADPGAVRAWAEALLAASALVDDLGTFAAGPAQINDWQGLAALVYRASALGLGDQAHVFSMATRSLARRAAIHAERLEQLKDEHVDLTRAHRVLEVGVHTLRVDLARSSAVDLPVLHARGQALRDGTLRLEDRTTGWLLALRVEEAQMVRAISRVTSLEQIQQRYAGVADPADGVLEYRPEDGASPTAVRQWWEQLTRRERMAGTAAAPEVIGALAGLPARARDRANVASLRADLATAALLGRQGLLTERERRHYATARSTDTARRRLTDRGNPQTGAPVPAQLLLYDPGAFDDDGAVAVAAGDLDAADHVAVIVPGFGSEGAKVAELGDRAGDLHDAAGALDPSDEHAVLLWLGYDAPDPGSDVAGVLGEQMAAAGGERLSETVAGLRASRVDDPAHLTVIGHSYGSTTVGHAALAHDLRVDDLVVVGSPGIGGGAEHASDLGVAPGHVWAGAASHDPITRLADRGAFHLGVLGGTGLGADPVEDAFGATRFEAEPLPGVPGRNPLLATHQGYFDPGSESLHNLGHIVGGDHDLVHHAPAVHDPWFGPSEDPERNR